MKVKIGLYLLEINLRNSEKSEKGGVQTYKGHILPVCYSLLKDVSVIFCLLKKL